MSGKTVRMIALVVVMAAATCALTLVVQFPVPATGGYIHLGDVAANFSALAFGPWLGFLIAGGGMAIADLIAGYAIYAPATLVIHGLQAVVVATIGRQRRVWLMFVGSIVGGAVVVAGYFLYQALVLGMGSVAAAREVPFNVIQAITGLVGVPVYILVAQAYPPLVRWVRQD
jgi:energy-coupling factor transport system substrate-specific component